jgi:hypothetical protein
MAICCNLLIVHVNYVPPFHFNLQTISLTYIRLSPRRRPVCILPGYADVSSGLLSSGGTPARVRGRLVRPSGSFCGSRAPNGESPVFYRVRGRLVRPSVFGRPARPGTRMSRPAFWVFLWEPGSERRIPCFLPGTRTSRPAFFPQTSRVASPKYKTPDK